MNRLRSKLTYSNVISTVCLVLLVGGGTAFAASKMLPKNSVGSKQIKKEAVTPAKLSKAVKARLGGPVGPAGPKGAAGPRGEQGPEGKPSPAYFATVSREGPGFIGSHPGFTAVTHPEIGVYCLSVAAGVNFSHPLASVEWANSEGFDLLVEPNGESVGSTCSSGRLEVLTYKINGGVAPSDNVAFTVLLPQE